jgi:hypothetical protein
MRMNLLLSLIISVALFIQCHKKEQPLPVPVSPFESTPVTSPVIPGIVDEASGIADSKQNPGYVWVQQDGGNGSALFLLSHNGTVQKKISILPAQNRDWEDMVLGNGPVAGVNYIYLAEIGDNNASYSSYSIYRFEEPSITTDTVTAVDTISFQYPDGAHDAEAVLLDGDTKDIYIITKRDVKSKIYKLAYPQNTSSLSTAIAVGELSFNGVTSAALSPDGKEILVKTYTAVYYWKRKNNEPIVAALMRNAITTGYVTEPQGEALCFTNDNSAFLTLSEKPFFATSVTLNRYKRK